MVSTTMMIASTNPTKPLPRRLLIVDDHPDMATTLARTVAQVCPGLEVLASCGGPEALEQVRDLPVDVLITDLMMPEMNGLELIEKLGSRPAGPPAFIVLITAYDIPGLEESAQRLKINETILKPFPPGLLVQTVRRALDEMDRPRAPQPQLG